MAQSVVNLKCPGCGASVTTQEKNCRFCGRNIIISTFNSVYSMELPEVNKYAKSYKQALDENPNDQDLNNSVAMCYLKLKLYDKALVSFENAMEENFDNPETFFYAAVSLLKGNKAFTTPLGNLKKAIEYLNSANMIEPRGIYYYFLAYIKYDYYARKYLKISPDYMQEIEDAKVNNVSMADITYLFEVLGQEIPSAIKIF